MEWHCAIMENGKHEFQETRQVLQRFGKSIEEAKNNYRDFLTDGITGEETDDLLRTIRENSTGKRGRNYSGLWVIGDIAFQKLVYADAQNNRVTLARYKRDGISLDELST